MKATGIVRRIDDLGRVVIPKEIRRTMRIREGEPLEIFTTDEGDVIFKKYSHMGELSEISQKCADSISKANGLSVIVTDRDKIVAFSGLSKHGFKEKALCIGLQELIEKQSRYVFKRNGEKHRAVDGSDYYIACFAPIVVNGDATGGIATVKEFDKSSDSSESSGMEITLINTAADFLARQFEE